MDQLNEEPDVVDLLIGQHAQIRKLLTQITVGAEPKQERFDELVRLLAVHESAEEAVVHPKAARARFGAEDMVEQRLDEEQHAKQALADLAELGVDHPDFDRSFAELADAVRAHAASEEAEEFTLLRRQYPDNWRRRMAGSLTAAEAMAPTRPHPHAGNSGPAAKIAGPPLAVFDHARDAVRDWLRSHNNGD